MTPSSPLSPPAKKIKMGEPGKGCETKDGIETAKDSCDDSDSKLKTDNYSVLTDEDGETAVITTAAAVRTSEKYSSIDKNSASKLEYCRVRNQNDIVTIPASDDETSDESMNLVQEREKFSVQTATSSKFTMENTQDSVSVCLYDETNRKVQNSGTPTKFSYADVLKSSPTKERQTPRKEESTASHGATFTVHDFHENDDTDKEDVANDTDVSEFNSSQDMFGSQELKRTLTVSECTAGCELDELGRLGVTVPHPSSPLKPSSTHTVLLHSHSLNLDRVPAPYPTVSRDNNDVWDNEHVRLPWSRHNQYVDNSSNNNGRKKKNKNRNRPELKSRWRMIKEVLGQQISSTLQLREAILSYNSRFYDDPNWSFQCLHEIVEDFNEAEEELFFTKILPGMIKLCLAGPEEITGPIPLLRQSQRMSISLSQHQISILLANAFFCTFPRRNNAGPKSDYVNYPDINFNRLLSVNIRRPEAQAEKIKCILAYFRNVIENPPVGVVTFKRQVLSRQSIPNWRTTRVPMSSIKLRISMTGTIETDGQGMLQVDFANKFVGGGVLGQGLVQEEIRFTICPELIISRLFTEVLGDREVLLMKGAQQYSRYTGYGDSFKFAGSFIDTTEVDSCFRRATHIVAMDATLFHSSQIQYCEKMIIRELNKAYAGFQETGNHVNNKKCAVATGNWGCGAFRGDPELKFLIQLMAAAQAGRSVYYLTFGDSRLVRNGWRVFDLLSRKDISVGLLYSIIAKYRGGDDVDLLEYVEAQVQLDIDPELVFPTDKTDQPYSAYDEDTDDETPSSPVYQPISSPVEMNAQDLAILSEYKNVDTSSTLINGPGTTETFSQGPEGSLASLELVCTREDPCKIKSCTYKPPCLRAQPEKSKITPFDEVRNSTTSSEKEVNSYTTNSQKEVRISMTNSEKEVRSSTTNSEKEVKSYRSNSEKEVRSSSTLSEKEVRSSTTLSEKEVRSSTTLSEKEVRSSTTLSEKEVTEASSTDPLDILENGLKSSVNSRTKNSVFSVKSEKKSKREEKNKITNYLLPKPKKK